MAGATGKAAAQVKTRSRMYGRARPGRRLFCFGPTPSRSTGDDDEEDDKAMDRDGHIAQGRDAARFSCQQCHDLPGVLTYRDLDDVQAMMLAAQSRAKAVVIGGGLLGLEAAAGLNAQGMDVTVLHVMPTLMERQLDPAAGYLLQRAVEARGIKVITKANTQAITGNGKVEQVELADGTLIPATLVVMASATPISCGSPPHAAKCLSARWSPPASARAASSRRCTGPTSSRPRDVSMP